MKVTSADTFGAAVREQRKQLGYTQKYISDVTGLSASYISELENGKQTVELGKAIRLANVLGLDLFLEKRI